MKNIKAEKVLDIICVVCWVLVLGFDTVKFITKTPQSYASMFLTDFALIMVACESVFYKYYAK